MRQRHPGVALRGACAGAIAAAVLLAPPACAATVTPAAVTPAAALAAPAPQAWRAYLAAARQADAIADPLARCLAFPDLPDNHWPDGHAAAMCRLSFANPVTLADIGAHLQRGDLGALDRRFARDLGRHWPDQAASEIIHLDFAAIDDSDQAAGLTERWLAKAPASPWANLARAQHLLALARSARGEQELRNLPSQRRTALTFLSQQAITLLGRAATLEPQLIHVYAVMVELAALSGADGAMAAAYERGAALDPGCRFLTRAFAAPLAGSYEGVDLMQQYVATLDEYLPRRPLLAATLAEAPHARGRLLYADYKFPEAVSALRQAAGQAATPAVHVLLAQALVKAGRTDRWEHLALLLQASRFGEAQADNGHERARALMRAGEHEWAIAVLERRLARDADPAQAHALLALAYANLKQDAETEPHYLAVMRQPTLRAEALHALTLAMGRAGQYDKAARYAGMAVKEQPDWMPGWKALGVARFRLGDPRGAKTVFEQMLARINAADPAMAGAIFWLDTAIAYLNNPESDKPKPADL